MEPVPMPSHKHSNTILKMSILYGRIRLFYMSGHTFTCMLLTQNSFVIALNSGLFFSHSTVHSTHSLFERSQCSRIMSYELYSNINVNSVHHNIYVYNVRLSEHLHRFGHDCLLYDQLRFSHHILHRNMEEHIGYFIALSSDMSNTDFIIFNSC